MSQTFAKASVNFVVSPTASLMNLTAKRNAPNPTSMRPRIPGKHYRLQAMPGDEIRRKEVIATQATMKWHPGLNVGITPTRSLYALCDGILVISEEKFVPDWNYPVVQDAYIDKNGTKLPPDYMRYLNIIPKKRVPEFKLVDVV